MDLNTYVVTIPRVKKTGYSTLAHNFAKHWPFSKFFHQQTQQWLPNGMITKDPTAP